MLQILEKVKKLKNKGEKNYDEAFLSYLRYCVGKKGIEAQVFGEKIKEELKTFLQKKGADNESEFVAVTLAGVAFDLKRIQKRASREFYEGEKKRILHISSIWLIPDYHRPNFTMVPIFGDFRAVNKEGVAVCLKELLEKYYPKL